MAGSSPWRDSIAVMPGKRVGEIVDRPGVEPRAAGRIGRRHRPGHHIPRRQLAPGIELEGEPAARLIQQQRAGAANGLGDRAGPG